MNSHFRSEARLALPGCCFCLAKHVHPLAHLLKSVLSCTERALQGSYNAFFKHSVIQFFWTASGISPNLVPLFLACPLYGCTHCLARVTVDVLTVMQIRRHYACQSSPRRNMAAKMSWTDSRLSLTLGPTRKSEAHSCNSEYTRPFATPSPTATFDSKSPLVRKN